VKNNPLQAKFLGYLLQLVEKRGLKADYEFLGRHWPEYEAYPISHI
jgi:hypothetical protein